MGQLKVVYQATSEFTAVAVRNELAAHGIPSVQLLNEIPMRPGFTFEARPWAEVLVSEDDLLRARKLVADLELAIHGGETAAAYPPVIKLSTTAWLGIVWASLLVLRFTLGVIGMTSSWELNNLSSPWGFSIWFAPDVMLGVALIILNWRMLSRHVTAAIGGLLALPVILAWLIINAIPWLIRTAVSFGKFKDSGKVKI